MVRCTLLRARCTLVAGEYKSIKAKAKSRMYSHAYAHTGKYLEQNLRYVQCALTTSYVVVVQMRTRNGESVNVQDLRHGESRDV